MALNFYDYHDFQKNQGAIDLWNTLCDGLIIENMDLSMFINI